MMVAEKVAPSVALFASNEKWSSRCCPFRRAFCIEREVVSPLLHGHCKGEK